MSECHYKHHETYGQRLTCPKCKMRPLECGPFDHGCRFCDKPKFRKCIMCHKELLYCVC